MKHKHHIIPRHAGGSDEPSNLVEVTVEEHANLHLSLYLEHGRWQDWLAFHAIAGIIECEDVVLEAQRRGGAMTDGKNHWTAETYEKLRRINLGRKRTDEEKEKVRQYNIKNKTFQRAADANKKPILFEGVEYESIHAAHLATGINHRRIKKVGKFILNNSKDG